MTSILYNISQSGNPRSAQTASSAGGNDSVARRTVASALTGEIWFTFLGQLTDNNDRAALTINPTNDHVNGDDADFIFVGSGSGDSGQFRVRVGSNSTTLASNLKQDGSVSNLVLGQIIINDSGVNDTLNVWLNPDLTSVAGVGDFLANFTPDFTLTTFDWVTGSQISVIGVASYGYSPDGGIVDNIRMSDNTIGFSEVTGAPVPKPATALVWLGLGACWLVRARGREGSSPRSLGRWARCTTTPMPPLSPPARGRWGY